MYRIVFFSALLGFVSANCVAVDADQIILKGEEKLRGKSTQALFTMVIARESYTRKLKLRSWTSGKAKALVEILDPAKESGVSSLRVGNEMWNYLPKTDQVIRIPPSLMLQSWMGSDFTNDDLMKSSSLSRDYTHRFIKKEKIGKDQTVLIECLPKKGAPVVWGKVHYWARLKDNLPVRQKYFDDQNKWVRTVTLSRFKKMDDRIVPSKMRVVSAETPREHTTITYEKILYDRKVPNAMFNREKVRHVSQQGKILASGWYHFPRLGRYFK